MKKNILTLLITFLAFNICYAKWHKINMINPIKLRRADTIPDSLKYIKKADSTLSLHPAYITPNYLKLNVMPYIGANYAPITGGSGYIQRQQDSAQPGNLWVSGNVIGGAGNFGLVKALGLTVGDLTGWGTFNPTSSIVSVNNINAAAVLGYGSGANAFAGIFQINDNSSVAGLFRQISNPTSNITDMVGLAQVGIPTPNGSGVALYNELQSSAGIQRKASRISTLFTTNTDGNESAAMTFNVISGGAIGEIMRLQNGNVIVPSLSASKIVFTASDKSLTSTGPGTISQFIDGTGALQNISTFQSALTLTTTGNFGAATFAANVLNIPTYTLAGLGGVSGSGTTNFLPKFTSTSSLGNSLIFDNGANVGIGTSAPNAKLDVNGLLTSGGQQANLDPAAPTGDISFLKNSGHMLVGWNMSASLGETDFIANPGIGTEGGYAFYNMDNSGTLLQTLRIKQNGNTGIGVDNPDAKLAVNGTVHAKEVLVDLNIFPDYVFKPTYHLPTLAEVKTYIDQNHHLPDMPTEAEVVKNGLKVGETENLLTKKVEELTLYLIDLKKENEALKQNQQAITKKLKQHHIN